MVVSLPAGATGVEADVEGVDVLDRVFRFDLGGPETGGLGG